MEIMIYKYLLQIQNMDWHVKATAFFLSFFTPLSSLIHVIIILLIVDAITSIYYQMKLATLKEKGSRTKLKAAFLVIESAKLRKTLEKMFFYVLMVSVFFMFDRYVLQIKPVVEFEIYSFSLTNLAAMLIAIVELTSIASNVSKITGNPVFDRIIKIFSKKVDKKFEIEEDES